MHLLRRTPPFTLIFIHIPKTAGSSLREVLLKKCRPPHFWIVNPIKDAAWLRTIPIEERRRYSLVEGHMYYGIHEILPRPCVYMTMLRDPIERILSLYSHYRERSDHYFHDLARELSLADFLRRGVTTELDNFMVRALTSYKNAELPFGQVTPVMLSEAKSRLEGMLVGITEHFDQSLAYFAESLNWRKTRASRTNATVSRLKHEDLSKNDLALIGDYNALDRELYDFAQTLFQARIRGESTLVPEIKQPASSNAECLMPNA